MGVLPGFATGNKIPCGQNLSGSQNLGGSCLEFAMRTIININQTTRRWQNYVLYCSPKYCWHDCYQPCTCFLIELSLMWYYFLVTITRRQRIVHVHVLLLQRAELNVVDWFPRSPWKPRGARSVAGGRRQVSFFFICCEIRSICRRITNEQEEFEFEHFCVCSHLHFIRSNVNHMCSRFREIDLFV